MSRCHGKYFCLESSTHQLRILERPQLTSNLVHQLLAQWGGGTVLLETASGDLSVLVSALSEPVRPWADALSPAERFLPGQLVLRRGKPSWMANLAEGLRLTQSEGHTEGHTHGRSRVGEHASQA